jgi:hypothetical protein
VAPPHFATFTTLPVAAPQYTLVESMAIPLARDCPVARIIVPERHSGGSVFVSATSAAASRGASFLASAPASSDAKASMRFVRAPQAVSVSASPIVPRSMPEQHTLRRRSGAIGSSAMARSASHLCTYSRLGTLTEASTRLGPRGPHRIVFESPRSGHARPPSTEHCFARRRSRRARPDR